MNYKSKSKTPIGKLKPKSRSLMRKSIKLNGEKNKSSLVKKSNSKRIWTTHKKIISVNKRKESPIFTPTSSKFSTEI